MTSSFAAGPIAWIRSGHGASDQSVPTAASATSAMGSRQIGRSSERGNARRSTNAKAISQGMSAKVSPVVVHGSSRAISATKRAGVR
ncbi:hypothetical protein ABH989_002414 [Bradyrhizobium ottawaense]